MTEVDQITQPAALEMAAALKRLRDNYYGLGPFPNDKIWDSIITECFAALAKATDTAERRR